MQKYTYGGKTMPKITMIVIDGFNTGLGMIEGEERDRVLYDFNLYSEGMDYTRSSLYYLRKKLDIRFVKKEVGNDVKYLQNLCNNFRVKETKGSLVYKPYFHSFKNYISMRFRTYVSTPTARNKFSLLLRLGYYAKYPVFANYEGSLIIKDEDGDESTDSFDLKLDYIPNKNEARMEIIFTPYAVNDDFERGDERRIIIIPGEEIEKILTSVDADEELFSLIDKELPENFEVDRDGPPWKNEADSYSYGE